LQGIRDAMFQMSLDKSSGPDGYNAFYFQLNWDLVKEDVVAAVQSFRRGKPLKQLNQTFLSMVPKMGNRIKSN